MRDNARVKNVIIKSLCMTGTRESFIHFLAWCLAERGHESSISNILGSVFIYIYMYSLTSWSC